MLDNLHFSLKDVIASLEEKLKRHISRAQELENKAALYGASVEASVPIELKEIKGKIDKLKEHRDELEHIYNQLQEIISELEVIRDKTEVLKSQLESLSPQPIPRQQRFKPLSILFLLLTIVIFFIVLYTRFVTPAQISPQPPSNQTSIADIQTSTANTSPPSPVAPMTVTIEPSQMPSITVPQSATPQNTNEPSPSTSTVQPTIELQPSDTQTVIPSLTSTQQLPTDIPSAIISTPTPSPIPTEIPTFTPSPLPSPPPTSVPSFTPTTLPTLSPTQIPTPPSTFQPNVQNGDFEDETKNANLTKQWTIVTPDWAAIANKGHNSNRSLRFDSQETNANNEQNRIGQTIEGLPVNQSVRVRVWVFVEHSDAQRPVQVQLLARDPTETPVTIRACTDKVSPSLGEWHEITLNYVVDDSGSIRVGIYIYGKGRVYIDDISLEASSDTTTTPCSQ